MYLKVVLLLLYSFPISMANRTELGIFKLLDEPLPKFRLLQNILMHAFHSHHCVQVTTDMSPLALEAMSEMYKISTTWTFISGVNLNLKNCNGYVLIAKHLKSIRTLLTKIPLYFEHRIVCLVGGGFHRNLPSFITYAHYYFKDSEVLLAISGAKPAFYKRIQPNSFLTRIIFPHGEWENRIFGVTDFKGKKITIGTFNCSLFSQLGPSDESGGASAVKGTEINLLLEIFKRLNLSYKIKVTTNFNSYGKLVEGKWTGGIFKMVTRGEVDIANCGIWMTYPVVSSGIEMSFPLGQTCLKLLVPRPKLLSTEWYDVLTPFSNSLWLFVIATVLLAAFLLKIFKKVTSLYDRNVRGHNYTRCLSQVLSIVLLSGVVRTKRGALRQLVTWFVVGSLVLTTNFSSGLISNLTYPRYTKKIEKLKDLIKHDFYWAEDTVPDYDVMFNMEDEWQKEWVKRMRVIPSVESVERLMKNKKLVKYGQQYKGAFFFEHHYKKEILEEFEVASECDKKFFFGFANRRGSPFFLPIKKYIHRFHNSGIIQKITTDAINELALSYPYVREVLRVTKSRMGLPRKLTLHQLRGAFVVWAIGIAFSLLVFAIEKYCTNSIASIEQ